MQIKNKFPISLFGCGFRLILFLITFYPCFLFSQNGNKTVYIELTAVDITSLKISSTEVSIFNIHLGMTISEIKAILDNSSQVYILHDPYHSSRYYICDKAAQSKNIISLAYLIIDEKDHKLKEITLYPEFSKYAVDSTRLLFTPGVFNKNSYIAKTFLGNPYKRKMLVNIPSIGLTSCAYYYHKNFMVTKNIADGQTTIFFSFLLKPD